MFDKLEEVVETSVDRRGVLGWFSAFAAGAAELFQLASARNEVPKGALEFEYDALNDSYRALHDEYERIRDGQVLASGRDCQAMRIMRHYGLSCMASTALAESKPLWRANWNWRWFGPECETPEEALIQAEPLFVEWCAEQERVKAAIDVQDGWTHAVNLGQPDNWGGEGR